MRMIITAIAAIIITASFTSCSNRSSEATSVTQLNGAGSTFVYPIMSKWASEYSGSQSETRINYQSIGSGGGIQQVSEGMVDFGATDGPMTDGQLAASNVGPILHVPLVMGADVPAYNVPGVSKDLRFTPALLAEIFLGRVNNWSDPKIANANPGTTLPNAPIVVIHRSDGSGTTYIWTDYLSKVSAEWKQKVGTATSVNWPTGMGASGNVGVADMIRQTSGAIGYLELTYAEENKITFGSVQNSSGTFVRATTDSVTAAGQSAKIPDDFRYSITNASGEGAYPISGISWLLVPTHTKDAGRRKMIVSFADWILGPGQELAPSLHYARLPNEVVARARTALARLK